MKTLHELFFTPLFYRTPEGLSENYGEGAKCWERRARLRLIAGIVIFSLTVLGVYPLLSRQAVYPKDWVHHGVLLEERDCIVRWAKGDRGMRRMLYCPGAVCEYRRDRDADGFHEVYCVDLAVSPGDGV